ncbi:MAG TPA: hemolysin family protein [Kofleriaceae bacterium]|nr:hemolysin family protein [Kofleriaceae bacterium]
MSVLSEIAPHLFILGVLIAMSAFFSGSEVALFSLRRVDQQQLASSERKSDRMLVHLLARPRRLIATILIGNEMVNVSASVVVASMVPLIFPGRGDLELGLISTAIALPLLLFFGEISPKTVAIKSSMGWARRAAQPLWWWFVVISPIRAVVRVITNVIMYPFGGNAQQGPEDLSEEEYKALVDAGSAQGQLKAEERRLIHRVFEFGDKKVGQVMIPRRRVFALAYDLPTARLIKEIAAGGYSRVPIYQKSLDRVMGIIYAKDLVVQGAGLSAPRRLVDLLHEPLFVPRSIPVERLFRIFKQRKTHMAVVVNEYGKVVGIVTMEDLLEELFGEILDEREQQKASVKVTPRLSTEPGVIVPMDKVEPLETGPFERVSGGDGEGDS